MAFGNTSFIQLNTLIRSAWTVWRWNVRRLRPQLDAISTIVSVWVNRFVQGMFLLLAILQILDLHSTFVALSHGRSEANIFILHISRILGIYPTVALFKLAAICLTVIYYKCARRYRNNPFLIVSLFTILRIYVVVVVGNYSSY